MRTFIVGIKDIGRRVEIVNLDVFHEITIALYQQDSDNGFVYLVHTYSSIEGGRERVEFITQAMRVLGGMEVVNGEVEMLRFACGHEHLSLVKILFLQACKVDPNAALKTLPLTVTDIKSDQDFFVESLGSGDYELTASGKDEKKIKRVQTVINLMVKHGGMNVIDESPCRISFPCGMSHDILAGLLLAHAVKVRVSALA
jgi:hypothetical protein